MMKKNKLKVGMVLETYGGELFLYIRGFCTPEWSHIQENSAQEQKLLVGIAGNIAWIPTTRYTGDLRNKYREYSIRRVYEPACQGFVSRALNCKTAKEFIDLCEPSIDPVTGKEKYFYKVVMERSKT